MVLSHFLLAKSEDSSSSLEKKYVLISSLTQASSTTTINLPHVSGHFSAYVSLIYLSDSFPNKCHLFPGYLGLIATAYMTFVSTVFHLFKAVGINRSVLATA